MKNIILVSLMILGYIKLIALPEISFAELIEHHGMMIEVVGNQYDCIICHDGFIASTTQYCSVKCGFNSSHSVFKDYPPRMNEGYAPVESLEEKGVLLIEGKITCISCHDMKNSAEYHLIQNNNRSSICLICHIK